MFSYRPSHCSNDDIESQINQQPNTLRTNIPARKALSFIQVNDLHYFSREDKEELAIPKFNLQLLESSNTAKMTPKIKYPNRYLPKDSRQSIIRAPTPPRDLQGDIFKLVVLKYKIVLFYFTVYSSSNFSN
ncbi:predicted protein [Sclerotinia sclerotiorum 1980 UF-70]|uniref:Uncharacterized protein n=1 Tax=Sclerotinia sclerotiorum (strain ATCC 18683 / 1980 / Ss-1) TaxID=665079 RepID=A7F8A9_SCLS1|nr:predicted protein [Sclerotinia sclerotiorum 1980 UF-70]EDN98980.1 predicted protein [Sclerotinia sclerotiorum 1980 UF-70]